MDFHSWWMLMVKMITGYLLAMKSEFVPDEWWQSSEVAIYQLTGKGHLTWEWLTGLRNYIVPGVLQIAYWLSTRWEGTDYHGHRWIVLPLLLQGALSCIGMYAFFEVARKRMGPVPGYYAHFLLTTSWFTTFTFTRPITNQTEMTLNILAMLFLQTHDMAKFGITLALNFLIRPTAAIFWVAFIPELWQRYKERGVFYVLRCVVPGLFILCMGTLLDCWMYGRFVLTWWNFFKFNLLEGGSANFGEHPLLWYFYSALPQVFGPLVLLLPFGWFMGGEPKRMITYFLWFVGVYSLIPHKEIRFLLPGLPLAYLALGAVVERFREQWNKLEWPNCPNFTFLMQDFPIHVFVIINILTVLFVGGFHQYGLKPSGRYISQKIASLEAPRVWALTPCYSVPMHSYIVHPNVEFEFYICPPAQFRHLYMNDTKAPLFQLNGFDTVDILQDIKTKVESTGPPNFVIVFKEHYSLVEIGFEQVGLKYDICREFPHAVVPSFYRAVMVLCDDERKYATRAPQKRSKISPSKRSLKSK